MRRDPGETRGEIVPNRFSNIVANLCGEKKWKRIPSAPSREQHMFTQSDNGSVAAIKVNGFSPGSVGLTDTGECAGTQRGHGLGS